MRLFLAISPADETKQAIHKAIEPLQKAYPAFRWIPPHNYHITLFFFGRVDDHKVPQLVEMIDRGIYDIPSFRLYTNSIGRFVKNNLDLYVNFHKNQTIELLVKHLKNSFGIVDDLHFFPHLTIARYKLPSKQQYFLIKKKIEQYQIDVEFDITQITLLNSVIENNKPHYEIVKEYALYSKH